MAIWRTEVHEFGVFFFRENGVFLFTPAKEIQDLAIWCPFLREFRGVLLHLCLSVNEDCALRVSLHLGLLSLAFKSKVPLSSSCG